MLRKTAKKAAKKPFSTAKKTIPELKKVTVTVEELKVIVADLAKGHAKIEVAHAKTEAAIEKLAENHAKTEAAHAKTEAVHAKTEAKMEVAFKKLADAHAKTEAAIQELSAENRLLAAEVRETSTAVRELHYEVKETSAAVRELNDTLGGMGGHLGEVIEFIVVPKIRLAINALGDHSFKEITARKIVETVINGRKRKLTEVDVLLYGDTEAMAVEIKTCLQTSDVDKHMERLQRLRDHEADAEIKGKTLFGAVVGAIVHDPIRTYALKKGLYVIEIREEEDKLDIDKPDTCRTW